MWILIIIYIISLLAVSVYVGINVYHILRFRTKAVKDKSGLALVVYLGLVSITFLVTVIGAVIAYNI